LPLSNLSLRTFRIFFEKTNPAYFASSVKGSSVYNYFKVSFEEKKSEAINQLKKEFPVDFLFSCELVLVIFAVFCYLPVSAVPVNTRN
jgi:hypothetical protein